MGDVEKSNKPKDNALFQQRLSAWKPILTLKDAFIFFLISGIVVLSLGLIIFFTHQSIVEVSEDYTECNSFENSSQKCSDIIAKNSNSSCMCQIKLNLSKDIKAPVYMYYGLTGFYQNHRQYVKSFDVNQLLGNAIEGTSENCKPFYLDPVTNKPYAPCGAMANYLFNDTFSFSYMKTASSNILVPFDNKGIALTADTSRYKKISDADWNKTVKPPSWRQTPKERSVDSFPGDEELLVWIRPAPLPSFRKLHRILITKDDFSNGLPSGNYLVNITYGYPVTVFGGRKFIVLTNLGWLGGKNEALSALYLAVGALHLLIAIVLLAVWCHTRNQAEVINLNNTGHIQNHDDHLEQTKL